MPDTLLCVHRGGDDDTSLYWCQGTTQSDGSIQWSGDNRFSSSIARSADGPALAVFNNTIYCVFRDENSDHLQLTYWDRSIREWRARSEPLTTAAVCTPALFARNYYGQGQKLYCIYQADRGGEMYWAICDNPLGEWQFNRLADSKMCSGVSAATLGGSTYCFHRGIADTHPANQATYWSRYQDDNNWTFDTVFRDPDCWSSNGPSGVAFDNKIVLVRRGQEGDANIYTTRYTQESDGDLKIYDGEFKQNNNASAVGPTAVTCNGYLYCIHPTRDDDRLAWARWDESAKNWMTDSYFGGHRSSAEVAVIAISTPL